MDCIAIKPNYHRLSKYFQFEGDLSKYPVEYPILMDRYSSADEIDQLIIRLDKVFETHLLSEFCDDILYILLPKIDRLDHIKQETKALNPQIAATKELADLLLMVEQQSEPSELSITVKRSGIKGNARCHDDVSRWVGKTIKEAILNQTYPVTNFGFQPEIFVEEVGGHRELSIEKLSEASEAIQYDIYRLERSYVAELCIFRIIPYLEHETPLPKNPNVRFSDSHLSFLYDLLVATGVLEPQIFNPIEGYLPKTYMRSYLSKHVNRRLSEGTKSS